MPFLPCSELPSSAGLSSCGNYVINCNNYSCNLCTEFLTQMLSKKQAKVIHVCLGFGGQDHVSKAVVKARPVAIRGKPWSAHKVAPVRYLHTQFTEQHRKAWE